MDQTTVISLGKEALEVAFILCAPILGLGLIAGLAVSILQAVTQIQDMTLTFVPKLVAAVIALVLFLPWMLSHIMDFTARLMGDINLWMQ